MRYLLIAIALLASPKTVPLAHYQHHGTVLLPDPHVTPGLVRTTSTSDVCSGGSTKQYRDTTAAMKRQVYFEYSAEPRKGICTGGCEVDHLISLELGGADDVANLWPQPSQPKPGFHEKDALENYLHKQVCSGKMALIDAQAVIRTDWYAAYLEAHLAR